MLTLESFFETPEGFKVFRDHADPEAFYYLPRPTIRVARNGDGLHFVAYTEDVTTDPDFNLSEDRAGGFLALEVELVHPTAALTVPSGVSAGTPRFAPVPFIGGTCELMLLAQKGAAGGAADGFQVTIVGSTAPVLDKPNNAVFSARVGGKAAEILWNTLRRTDVNARDSQAAVLYSMDYLALRPAYHLKIEIDFKYSFDYWRHRVGVNAVVLQADLDFMIQTAVNEGKIIIHEENFQEGNSDSLIGGSSMMSLIRDLMSDQLFHPTPVPTPDAKALPDSASSSLTGAGGLSSLGITPGSSGSSSTSAASTSGSASGTTPAAQPISVGTAPALRLTHTPVTRGTPGQATRVAVTVAVADPGRLTSLDLKWRRRGDTAEQTVAFAPDTGTVADPRAAGAYHADIPAADAGTTIEYFITGQGRASGDADSEQRLPTGTERLSFPVQAAAAATTGTTATPVEQTVGTFLKIKHTPLAAQQLESRDTRVTAKIELATTPTQAAMTTFKLKWRKKGDAAFTDVAMTGPANNAAGDYSANIPGQPNSTDVEYYLEAKGRADTAAAATTDATITLPDHGDTAPLTYKAVTQAQLDAAATSSRNDRANPVPSNASPGIGYSLRSIQASEQIKRTFDLTRTTTSRQTYRAAGTISGGNIGADFVPASHVSLVPLGQGPFKLIQIEAAANFDFAASKVMSCKVHLDYPDRLSPTLSTDIKLDATHTSGKVQWMANEAGVQTFDYWVEMVYDADVVIGPALPDGYRSRVFIGQRDRHLMINLDQHSPLLPVHIEPGLLTFSDTTLRQVQVRLSPDPLTEAHVIKLDGSHGSAIRYIVPKNPLDPTYFMKQTFFFRDDSATFEYPDQRTTQVVVDEPQDLVYRMRPRLVDPTGLVEEAVLDASYTHASATVEETVLHLTPDAKTSEFTILRAPADGNTWTARPRFVLTGRDPVEAPTTLTFTSPEPFIGLKQAGLRVVHVEMLDDASVFTGDLRAIRVIMGPDVNDAAQPTTSVTLRAGHTTGVAIVPGVGATGAVSVATEVLRSGQPPARTVSTLPGSDQTFFVVL